MKRLHASVVWPLAASIAALGQQTDLTTMSLEDLMNVEVVSVRKSSQKLSRTPAAVYVITQNDIRRSGANSLPEALRLAPGIHVTRVSGTTWAIGMRGFNAINSDKLLVMIDGRTVYDPVITGVMWSTQLVPLEDVERIEVIRGPAGTMWGANAVTGVINVITFKASATQGLLATATLGTADRARSTLRYGGKRGRLAYRTWFHQETNGQVRRPEAAPDLGLWNTGRAGVRMDWSSRRGADQVTVEGEAMGMYSMFESIHMGRRVSQQHTPHDGGGWSGYLTTQWTHLNRRGDQTKFQVTEDLRTTNMGFARFGVRSSDADVQHAMELKGGHNLLAGGGFRLNRVDSAGTVDLWFEPSRRTYLISNLFVQDDWEILPERLVLTAGVKLENYTFAGPALQPSVRLMWTPSVRQGYWISAARAVRVPSHLDYALRYPLMELQGVQMPLPILFQGSRNSRPERLFSVEAGARWQLWRRASVEVSAFHSGFTGLNAFQMAEPPTPERIALAILAGRTELTATRVNGLNAASRGGEALIHYDVARRWRILASYSAAQSSLTLRPGFTRESTFDLDQYYPKHMGQVRSSWELGRWSMDAAVYRTGSLRSAGRELLGAYTRADLRIERKLGERFAVFASGRNLLRPWQQEYFNEVLIPPGEIGRNISFGIRWEQ